MLAPSGRLMGDLTTMRLAEDCFHIAGSGYLQTWQMRWFAEHLAEEGVQVRNVTDSFGGMALMGPNSRELLERVARVKLPNATLPLMGFQAIDLAFAPALVARLSVSGELGYEIYVPTAHLNSLLGVILDCADGLGLRHIGMYALNCLRLEKSVGIWSREFSRDYTPRMCGLDRFVAYDKPDFIGREAAIRDRAQVPDKQLVTLLVDACDADAAGYEPIWQDGRMIGFTTSGGYGHCADLSLAMGYIQSAFLGSPEPLSVTILGDERPCRVLTSAAVDPTGARMRS